LGLVSVLSGCSTPASWVQTVTSAIPSNSGTPNSVASFGKYEFVSVQGTGQIFTYNVSGVSPTLAVPAYTTPCKDPSGMVIAAIAGNSVMAVACFDTGSLLTLAIHSDGSLTPLGSVSGLPTPYPGIALDGTDVFLPLFGHNLVENGAVARVSIASPAAPAITGIAALSNPAPGEFANPGFLTVAGGYVFVAAGSEDAPQSTSSTIQVVNESTMALVGTPFVVAHSPQQIAIQGNVAYVTLFDTPQLVSVDISNPASLHSLQTLSLASPSATCHALPVLVRNNIAYVGCYVEGTVEEFDISTPTAMWLTHSISAIDSPQRMNVIGSDLLVASSRSGGRLYQIAMPPP
jgi:hypothetical protein